MFGQRCFAARWLKRPPSPKRPNGRPEYRMTRSASAGTERSRRAPCCRIDPTLQDQKACHDRCVIKARPTLKQVALRAGVSRSTAGAALSGSPRVFAATAEHVRQVAASLGYRTASHARLLRLGGPDLITLILDTRLTHADDGTLHPFWARVLTNFVTTWQQMGWLSIVQFQQPGGHVLQVPTAGVVMATHDDGSVSLSVERSFGQTVVSAPAESSHSRALKHDFSAVGQQCGDHLAQAGCHRILLLGRDGFPYAAKVLEGGPVDRAPHLAARHRGRHTNRGPRPSPSHPRKPTDGHGRS
jgi:hypothetical protein